MLPNPRRFRSVDDPAALCIDLNTMRPRYRGDLWTTDNLSADAFQTLGDYDAAFGHLDRAIHDRDPNILGLKSNPIFDALREDARYHALLKKMQLAKDTNLPDEHRWGRAAGFGP